MGPEVILVVVGVICGALAGLVGIAGGLFLIPALVIIFGYSEKMAQGTTLAILLMPIGIGAAYTYYRAGNVNVKAAIFIALGFVVGGLIGAHGSNYLSNAALTRIFGFLALAVAVKMLLFA